MEADIKLHLCKILLFLSGFAALVYEMVWTRAFADIIGSTASSLALVFSVFILGLATGAWFFGRFDLRGPPALALYGFLELAVAAAALISSLIMIIAKTWLAMSLGGEGAGVFVLQVLAVVLIMGPPAFLMGGTLPLMLSAAGGSYAPREVVAPLYGWNTLGAAIGVLCTGFFLIWHFGISFTIGLAIALNAGIGVLALTLARAGRVIPDPIDALRPEKRKEASPDDDEDGLSQAMWPVAAFLGGFVVLALEILWGRMSRFMLGDRTLAVAALLFINISCLGLASLLAPRIGKWTKGRGKSLQLIAWVFIITALIHLVQLPLATMVPDGRWLLHLMPAASDVTLRLLNTFLIMAPGILVAGLIFPLLAWSSEHIDRHPGRVVGNLYFINGVGAAIGAIFAGFVLCHLVGTLYGFYTLGGAVTLGAAVTLLLKRTDIATRAAAITAVVVYLGAGLVFPSRLMNLHPDERLLAINEDEYGVQILARSDSGTVRLRNNRLSLVADLGLAETSRAQQLPAHLATLLAANVENVINIGTGYGITAGTFTLYDQVEDITTIEIVPFVANNQKMFAPFNFNYMDDDRVRLIRADGRHVLTASSSDFDIISVNVLDPYLPGSSSLYTVDFWMVAREKLRNGGIFTALFWGADIELLVKGINTVFPTVLFFPTYGESAYIVVALKERVSREDLQPKLSRLTPAAIKALQGIDKREPTTLFNQELELAWKLRYEWSRRAARLRSDLHTDDHPLLEYRWAHGVEGLNNLDSPLVIGL